MEFHESVGGPVNPPKGMEELEEPPIRCFISSDSVAFFKDRLSKLSAEELEEMWERMQRDLDRRT